LKSDLDLWGTDIERAIALRIILGPIVCSSSVFEPEYSDWIYHITKLVIGLSKRIPRREKSRLPEFPRRFREILATIPALEAPVNKLLQYLNLLEFFSLVVVGPRRG